MSESLDLKEALNRAENAERREEQFRNWWAGVSKQLDDIRRQYAAETWQKATDCDTHGKTIADLDAQLQDSRRRHDDTEADRVKLVTGLHVLQDIVRAHAAGHTRTDLTVSQLVGAVGRIVARALDGRKPDKAEQLDLFSTPGAGR